MGNSFAVKRINSHFVAFVVRMRGHSLPYPHGKQSSCWLVAPTPQHRQGCVF